MKYILEFTPKAKNEFINAYRWYEDQKSGLGDTFRKEVYKFIRLILENPEHYPIKEKRLREIVLNKFPFLIVFQIHKRTQKIYIASIFHTKRNPTFK